MAVWVVRGGHLEDEALEHSIVSIGYDLSRDLAGASTREEMRTLVQLDHPNANRIRIGQITGQAWSFKELIKIGDLIVMPLKGQPTFAVGRMKGEYIYNAGRHDHPHCRDVEWINKGAPRSSLSEDLKKSLDSDTTVYQPRSVNAEERLQAIAEGAEPDPIPLSSSDDAEIAELSINLEEDANNRIRDYIGDKFRGHEFTWLVAAVLQAQGYAAEVAPPCPDGGVDIVAGSGPMGFDPPRICVQVKSGI